jgi:hypothetical protein
MAAPGEEIGLYYTSPHALAFYLGEPVRMFHAAADVERSMKHSHRMLLVLETADLPAVAPLGDVERLYTAVRPPFTHPDPVEPPVLVRLTSRTVAGSSTNEGQTHVR